MKLLRRLTGGGQRRIAPVRDVIDATALDLAGKASTLDWMLQSVPKSDPLITRETALRNAGRLADEIALAVAALIKRNEEAVAEQSDDD